MHPLVPHRVLNLVHLIKLIVYAIHHLKAKVVMKVIDQLHKSLLLLRLLHLQMLMNIIFFIIMMRKT